MSVGSVLFLDLELSKWCCCARYRRTQQSSGFDAGNGIVLFGFFFLLSYVLDVWFGDEQGNQQRLALFEMDLLVHFVENSGML